MPLPLENIVIGYNDDGRPSGEADVEFAAHSDAVQAMRKNNALMGKIDSFSCIITLSSSTFHYIVEYADSDFPLCGHSVKVFS